jgi:cyclic beta-1,2-glucan synthetase
MRDALPCRTDGQATELLLQERMPRDVAVVRTLGRRGKIGRQGARDWRPQGGRPLRLRASASPRTHLLSNGRYAVMLTAAGSGYSRWRDIAVTRWREDATCDDWGSYVFLRDVRSGEVWSAGYQPSGAEPDSYRSLFNEDRAEFTRRDGIADDDAGRARLGRGRRRGAPRVDHQSGNRAREIEVTSYAELVLAPQAADVAHPAFSKLFVETEYLADGSAPSWRRGGGASPAEPEIWAAHLASSTARRSASRNRDRPGALPRPRPQRTADRVMDGGPCRTPSAPCSIRSSRCAAACEVAPGAIVRVAFWTVVAESARGVLDLVDKHRDATAFERASERWPGPRRRCSCIISASIRARRSCSSVSPATCCMPARACGRRRDTIRAAPARSRGCGPRHFRRPADRAAAHRRHRTSRHRRNCCARTNTGG